MAYQSISALHPTDLLQQLVTFLAANGWTQDASQSVGSGWRAHLHRGAIYVNLRAARNEVLEAYGDAFSGIAVSVGSGYDAGANWRDQPGVPMLAYGGQPYAAVSVAVTPDGAIPSARFFAGGSGDRIVVVIEQQPGIFSHLFFGVSVTKIGSWTGGPYCGASARGHYWVSGAPGIGATALCPAETLSGDPQKRPSCYVRAEIDGSTWRFMSSETGGWTGDTGYRGGSSVGGGCSGIPQALSLITRTVSRHSGSALLLPVVLYAERSAGGWAPLGEISGVRACAAVGKGWAAGDTITIGSENWMTFPNFAVLQE